MPRSSNRHGNKVRVLRSLDPHQHVVLHPEEGGHLRTDEATANDREIGAPPCQIADVPEVGNSPKVYDGRIAVFEPARDPPVASKSLS
jgi:hypothetical protein